MTICQHCGKRIPVNTKCDCRKQRNQKYDQYDRSEASKNIYHSKVWPKLVADCKRRYCGLDAYQTMLTGYPVIARHGIAHHIVEVADDVSQAYDPDNIIFVSAQSHAKIHLVYDSGQAAKKALQAQLQAFAAKKTFLRRAGGV